MKKLLHFAALMLTVGTLTAQTIPNGGFEFWTNNIWMDPTGYFTANSQYVPNFLPATVTRVGPGFHGSYAVELTTKKVGPDTLQAYIADGNPSNNPPMGGIPYTHMPTGFRFHYQCNVMAGDTALVIVILKQAGTVIGGGEAKLTGNVGIYTLKTVPILGFGVPDTLVFAATSSNLLGPVQNFRGLPGSMLVIDSVTFTGVPSQPAGFNGDFENWVTDTAAYPTGWMGNYPGIIKTTDKKAGIFAVELQTVPPMVNGNNQASPGFLTSGIIGQNGPTMGGSPYTLQKDTLDFYYKYAPVGTDTANVSMEFKKNGVSVAWVGSNILPAASYTYMEVPFNIGTTPDSVIFYFQSTNTYNLANIHIGSDLKVDNLEFKSNPVIASVSNINVNMGLKVYPNPIKTNVYVDAQKFSGTVQSVTVYEMNGKTMMSDNHPSLKNNIMSIDMSSYAVGTYMLKVNTSNGVYTHMLSKVE